MEKFYVYLKLETYLRQWFVCNMGGAEPVELPRGSIERNIFDIFLSKVPENYIPRPKGEDEVAIVVPSFKHKDPHVYNYLPPHAECALLRCVKNRFEIELWNDLHRFGYLGQQQQDIIYAWMEQNGIELTETNWNTIAKIYQRKRNYYLNLKRKKK